jgi:YfiR/HmsC-like
MPVDRLLPGVPSRRTRDAKKAKDAPKAGNPIRHPGPLPQSKVKRRNLLVIGGDLGEYLRFYPPRMLRWSSCCLVKQWAFASAILPTFSTFILRSLVQTRVRRCHGGWLILSILLLSGGLQLSAQNSISPEYQIKAVFLFNFARFIDWPSKAFPTPETPMVIGVLGGDPFDGYLDETVRGEKVNGRALVVQRYHRVSEIKICHVLFISRSEAGNLVSIFTSLKTRPILTVSDIDEFTSRGGMISLVRERNKIRMHVNLRATKAAHLTVSSKLLRVVEAEH